tara:strand:+ start:2275 stop:2490 length:216 start_codon:yes stop_codon:yes gene_type:complete
MVRSFEAQPNPLLFTKIFGLLTYHKNIALIKAPYHLTISPSIFNLRKRKFCDFLSILHGERIPYLLNKNEA